MPAQGDFLQGLEQAGIVDASAIRPDQGAFASQGGQLFADAKQLAFRAVTALSECLVQAGPVQRGNALSVRDNTTFSTVFAGSLDGQPLMDSRRVLVLHLTDLSNSEERRSEVRGKLIIARGSSKYPLLIRRGSIEISLRNRNSGNPKIWALDVTGRRLQEVAFQVREGEIVFNASTTMNGFLLWLTRSSGPFLRHRKTALARIRSRFYSYYEKKDNTYVCGWCSPVRKCIRSTGLRERSFRKVEGS